MSPHLIIAAVIAAMGFGAAWQIQSWRYTSKEADREQQQLEQVQQSAAASIRRADNVIAAQNAANARSVVLGRDRDRAYLELERLPRMPALTEPIPPESYSLRAAQSLSKWEASLIGTPPMSKP